MMKYIQWKSFSVRFCEFRWSCFVSQLHEENCGKESVMTVRLQPCNLNIHCLTYRTMVFGFIFSTSNLLCRRKTRRKFHVSSKRENANFPVETASDNRQTRKMAGKSWSRGPLLLAFSVNVLLNLSDNRELKQRQRRRQRERHKFAY